MEARKKKCPECEAPQYDSVPESKPKITMATNKKSSTGAMLGGILLGIVLGAFGLYAYTTMQSETPLTQQQPDPSFATVSKRNGIYVFINAQPQKGTVSLGSYKYKQGNKLLDILNTKGENMFDEANTVLNMLVFDRKLDAVLEEVKAQYPEAECVVFTDRLDNCKVYKFSE